MTMWSTVAAKVGKRRFLRLAAMYPPFVGAGVRVVQVSGSDDSIDAVTVAMPLTRWNQTFVGTQFGGSLYAMCDPWFMLLLRWKLGPGHSVWDKSANIRFVKPGRGRVLARFDVPDSRVAEVNEALMRTGRAEPRFTTSVLDEGGETMATVDKLLSVRRR